MREGRRTRPEHRTQRSDGRQRQNRPSPPPDHCVRLRRGALSPSRTLPAITADGTVILTAL
jgi:hypothetical protein